MHVDVLLTCMSVYHMYDWRQQRPEEGAGAPETAVQIIVSCQVRAANQTRACWEISLSS